MFDYLFENICSIFVSHWLIKRAFKYKGGYSAQDKLNFALQTKVLKCLQNVAYIFIVNFKDKLR